MNVMTELCTLLPKLLEQDFYKTAQYLVEELRVEYPEKYLHIMKVYGAEYDLSACGMHQSPNTAVHEALNLLLKKGLVDKKTENGLTLWRLI